METIIGDFQALDLPECYQPAHERYLAGMKLDLEGVKEFDQTGDTSGQYDQADIEFAAGLTELQKLDE